MEEYKKVFTYESEDKYLNLRITILLDKLNNTDKVIVNILNLKNHLTRYEIKMDINSLKTNNKIITYYCNSNEGLFKLFIQSFEEKAYAISKQINDLLLTLELKSQLNTDKVTLLIPMIKESVISQINQLTESQKKRQDELNYLSGQMEKIMNENARMNSELTNILEILKSKYHFRFNLKKDKRPAIPSSNLIVTPSENNKLPISTNTPTGNITPSENITTSDIPVKKNESQLINNSNMSTDLTSSVLSNDSSSPPENNDPNNPTMSFTGSTDKAKFKSLIKKISAKKFKSNILRFEEIVIFIKDKVLKSSDKKISLIYQASKDSDSASKFHEICDGICPTLTIIETVKGKIFGGYTELGWKKKHRANKDPNAFLFSFNNKMIYKIKEQHSQAINSAEDQGPGFGSDDFYLVEPFFENGNVTSKKCSSYETNGNFDLNGEYNFSCKEVEVYKVETK